MTSAIGGPTGITRWAWPAPRWTARWSSACAHCRWTFGSTPASSICCSRTAWSGVSGSPTATRASTTCARGSSSAPTAARRWWPNGWGAGGPHALRRMALVTYVSGLENCKDLGEIFVDPPDYAILNPIAPDRVNLALVVPLAHGSRWSDRLRRFHGRPRPTAAAPGPTTGRRHARGAHPRARAARPSRRAAEARGACCWSVTPAGFYDPFTGEGVFTALRSAELAVTTIVRALRERGRVGAARSPATSGPVEKSSAARSA